MPSIRHLRRMAGEGGGDLGIEERGHRAEQRRQHLKVLPAGVQHLGRAARAQRDAERPQVLEGERIDADRPAARGELQQAELGAVGALAHELRVEPDGCLVLEVGEQVLETRGCADDGGVRRHLRTMQES